MLLSSRFSESNEVNLVICGKTSSRSEMLLIFMI